MGKIEVEIPVVIERWPGHLFRAKTLLPLKVELVGDSWRELQRRLTNRIRTDMKRIAPTGWVTGRVWEEVERGEFSFSIEPPPKRTEWLGAFPIVLDTFKLNLDGDQQCLLLPLLDLSIVGKGSHLTDELVRQQVATAIDRMLDRNSIETIVHQLDRRRYSIRMLRIPFDKAAHHVPKEKKSTELQFKRKTTTLRSVAIDLTTREDGKQVYCIDDQVAKLAERLLDESRPSILLVGPSGIGKTAIVQRLASQLSSDYQSDRHIWTTTGARIVSGMCGLGMWQQRVQGMIQEIRETDGMLHVGGLIEMIEAGKVQGQPGVASMLRTSIANGRIQVLAEATPDQIATVERDDPLLLRSFMKVELPPPNGDLILNILRQSSQGRFTEGALIELHQLFRRFATYSALPAPAIRLMRSMLEDSTSTQSIALADVTKAFAAQTGLPEFLLDDATVMNLDTIREDLSSHVIGQAEPVELVVNLLATFKARLSRVDRPLASLLFIGPTGVGKTEMAKAVAKIMYNDSGRMIRIDMSEYATPWSAIRLIGRPGEGDGTLVSPIREQPFSVVLLDEFEKADPAVFELLLQLLGEGRLTDSLGRLADFRNAIIIMTSNLGVESFRSQGFGFSESGSGFREHFERELKRFVRPELLGRIDRVVPFHPLSPTVVREIVLRELKAIGDRAGLKDNDVQLHVEPSAVDRLAEIGYIPRYGARPIRRAIEREIVLPLSCKLEKESIAGLRTVRVECNENKIEIVLEKANQEEIHAPAPVTDYLNQLRELRHKAKLSVQSDEFRQLENEIERNRRQRVMVERSLAATVLSGKTNRFREQLGELDKRSHEMLARRNRLIEVVADITAQEHSVMMDWYRNALARSDLEMESLSDLEERLRESVLQLQGSNPREAKEVTLILIGKDPKRADILWQAYSLLAQRMHWGIDFNLLLPYEPLHDDQSEAYRKRAARGTPPAPLPFGLLKVDNRLLGPLDENGVAPKLLDVHRITTPKSLDELPNQVVGFAVRFRGKGASSWLMDEHGIHHFVSDSRGAPSKRWRYRVDVTEKPLASWEIPLLWKEPPSLPERDPRRTYHLTFQTISDHLSDRTISIDPGSEAKQLAAWIQEQREMAVWRSIGYVRPERSVRFGVHENLDEIVIEDVQIPF